MKYDLLHALKVITVLLIAEIIILFVVLLSDESIMIPAASVIATFIIWLVLLFISENE